MSQIDSIHSIYFEIKQSLRLSLPLITSSFVQSSSIFVGMVMIAHLGRDALAAGGLVLSIFITVLVCYIGVLGAVSVLVAQCYGAQNKEGISLVVSQGFLLGAIMSIPAMMIFWFAPYILKWSGQDQHVIHMSTQYLHTLTWSMFPLAFLIVMEQFLIGLGHTRLVLWISILQIPCEIFANYCFIFGKFGIPAFGVAGLGYGFSVVFALAAVAIALFISLSKHYKTYQIFSGM